MTLSQLRHFEAVCRYNNVTKAAEELLISQPSISKSIKDLEAEFGVNLFHRLGKRLSLTKEGAFFLEHAEGLLEQSDVLLKQMKDFGMKKNLIKIGIPPMIGTFLFPPLFHEFNQKYPEICMEILEYGSLETRRLVENNTLDIAIVIFDETMRDRFNILPLLSTQLVYCVSKHHHLAGETSLTIQDLQEEQLILFRSDALQNAMVKKRFAAEGLKPNVLLHSSQLYTIKHFLDQGDAGTFLFEELVDMEPDLVGIPLEEPIHQEIGLIWKKCRHMYSDVERLIQFSRQYAASLHPQVQQAV